MLDFLPDTICAQLAENFGLPAQSESLSGLTDANVWRIRFTNETIVIKQTTKTNEAFFYEQVGPTLREQGIPSLRLWFTERTAESIWLILEDIPEPFPRQRWLANAEQLGILRRLHNVNGDHWRTHPSMYRPKWTIEMTEAALSWFPETVAHELTPKLDAWRATAQPIFAPTCLISGDPNPANWGLRGNGSLVHFDWERFGWGTPAIDLAITIPGFGTPDDFQRVAETYLGMSLDQEQQAVGQVTSVAKRIRIAKAWAVVELLSNLRTLGKEHHNIVTHLQKEFPAWLRQY